MGLNVPVKERKEGWDRSKDKMSAIGSDIVSAVCANSDLLLGAQHIHTGRQYSLSHQPRRGEGGGPIEPLFPFREGLKWKVLNLSPKLTGKCTAWVESVNFLHINI